MNDPLEKMSFEQCLSELDAVVRDLEDSQLGLEASLARYEQGVALLKRCYGKLREAEQRVSLLTGVDEENQPQLQPFQGLPPATTRGRKKPEEPRSSAY